jgi:antitoxin CptB
MPPERPVHDEGHAADSSHDPATGTAVPARLRWRCRRGMREMDMLMLGWLERHWPTASREAQANFEELVEQLDQDILAWVLGREHPPERFAARIAELSVLMSSGQAGAASAC